MELEAKNGWEEVQGMEAVRCQECSHWFVYRTDLPAHVTIHCPKCDHILDSKCTLEQCS